MYLHVLCTTRPIRGSTSGHVRASIHKHMYVIRSRVRTPTPEYSEICSSVAVLIKQSSPRERRFEIPHKASEQIFDAPSFRPNLPRYVRFEHVDLCRQLRFPQEHCSCLNARLIYILFKCTATMAAGARPSASDASSIDAKSRGL